MRTRLRPGLTGYSCVRSFVAWNLAVFAFYYLIKHYHVLPEFPARDFGDASYVVKYCYEVSGRILKDPFCLPMALVLIGSTGYALALVAAMRAVSRRVLNATNTALGGRLLGRLVGLPLFPDTATRVRLVGRGVAYATAPLRDAVTLFPAVGFLGTVVGVSIALGGLQKVMAKGDSSELMSGLLTAFDTTFLGLLAALVLTIVLFGIDAATVQMAALLEEQTVDGSA